ncbi:MAG: hypothetical protein AAF567_11690 [Actinomycetota bacterium]
MDHDGQVARLQEAAAQVGARFHTVECVGPCERSNVVIVRTGSQRRWLGHLGDAEVAVLADWVASGDGELSPAVARMEFEGLTGRSRRRFLGERGAELAELVAGLTSGSGTWTMGVPGAIAEFYTAVESPQITMATTDDSTSVTAIGSTGALRITIDAQTRSFCFGSTTAPEEPDAHIVVRTGPGIGSRDSLTELGPDPSPILPTVPGETAFDLGVGRDVARFMVRTADEALISVLRSAIGVTIDALSTQVWQALVDASPTRVVETALGRIEVTSPIPPPDGESPAGCHTHLLPDMLAQGEDLPADIYVPSGWRIGPIHYGAATAANSRLADGDPTAISG